MIYKDFQDLKLSALGMGCMRLPVVGGNDAVVDEAAAEEMVDCAMANGVNYYDTAWGYHNGNSEIALGKALAKHPREKFYIADKFPGYDLSNMPKVQEIFEEQLKKGDLLHIAFTSGQSGSVHNAMTAGKLLQEKYPDKKIVVIDSLCSSSGYGLLVDTAADMRDSGATLEETAQWVLDNRNKVHHQFFSSDMTQFRRTGRVSGAAAMVATIMNICPIMRLDDKGAIKAYGKVRGKKKAVEATVNAMEEHAQGGRDYDQKCFVCHSQCPEDARMLIDALEERFPKLKGKIRLCDIGTIIGSHSGPGTVAVFFMGDERPAMD